jgi:hypothetical protein
MVPSQACVNTSVGAGVAYATAVSVRFFAVVAGGLVAVRVFGHRRTRDPTSMSAFVANMLSVRDFAELAIVSALGASIAGPRHR